jgi:hypothetical protein
MSLTSPPPPAPFPSPTPTVQRSLPPSRIGTSNRVATSESSARRAPGMRLMRTWAIWSRRRHENGEVPTNRESVSQRPSPVEGDPSPASPSRTCPPTTHATFGPRRRSLIPNSRNQTSISVPRHRNEDSLQRRHQVLDFFALHGKHTESEGKTTRRWMRRKNTPAQQVLKRKMEGEHDKTDRIAPVHCDEQFTFLYKPIS